MRSLNDSLRFTPVLRAPAFTDAELNLVETERVRHWQAASVAGRDDEYLARMEMADTAEDLIRQCPCASEVAAVLKLRCVMRDLEFGLRSSAVDPTTLLTEVIQFLEAK
jgi:hypothetical protein